MYAIVTTNEKLVIYLKKINANFFEIIESINSKRYGEEVLVTTADKGIAMIALVEGEKVFETTTLGKLTLISGEKEAFVDKVIDDFFEALGICKISKGYDYLKYMLKCNVYDDCYCLKPMTTQVYPECAKKFNVSATTVAKYSQDIIKNSYERNSLKYDVLYFRSHTTPLTQAPKVNNFVVVMANKIRKNIMEEK